MKKAFLFSVIILLGFIACKNKEEAPAGESTPVMEATKGNLGVVDPWIRMSAAESNTALFFKVVNNTAENDTLYGAASGLAKKVEVHETYMKENDMMGMRHVENVVIPAGETVVFQPRDLHVMLMKLNNDLVIGDSGEVTLMFKKAGEIKVTGIVKEMPGK